MQMTIKELKEKGYRTLSDIEKEVGKRTKIHLLPADIEFVKINRTFLFNPDNCEKVKKYILLSKGEKKKIFLESGKSVSKTSLLKKEGYKSYPEILKKLNISKRNNLKKEFKEKSKLGLFSPETQKEIISWLLLPKQEKTKQTCIERYGADSPFKSKQVCDKIKQTCIERYGVDNPFKFSYFQNKAKETNKKNHNGLYNSQTKEWSELTKTKRKRLYKYDEIIFDSSWELVYYFYLKNNNIPFKYHPVSIEYKKNNIKKFYEPDFLVYNRFVELKGGHLLKDGVLYNPFTKEKYFEKTKCLKDNNVLLLTKDDIILYFNYAKKNNFNFLDFKIKE